MIKSVKLLSAVFSKKSAVVEAAENGKKEIIEYPSAYSPYVNKSPPPLIKPTGLRLLREVEIIKPTPKKISGARSAPEMFLDPFGRFTREKR